MAITIDLAALGNGTYTIQDDGTPGNGTSVVRDPLGNIVTTIVHPADALTILSRSGQSLDINITDSLTTADFTVGSLTDASTRPDEVRIGGVQTSGRVTLTANGAVSEWGSDAATDIVAGALAIEANGVGAAGNFIETEVFRLEAESATGGIAISNTGAVLIGGVTSELRGLHTASSGDITLVNQGGVTLDEAGVGATVDSAGHLSITAIGAGADISSLITQDAFLAAGNISLACGRDVRLGTIGVNLDNDVRAGGSIAVTAGRDFHIDGLSHLTADDLGLGSNGGVSITVGRDILIEDNNSGAASVGIGAPGGAGKVVLTTGIGGTLSLAANTSAAVQGGGGGVIVSADRILIESDSGISASGGSVTLSGVASGRLIQIGSATDGVTALELSDAELDRIFAQSLVIGSASSGQATVVGAISHPSQARTIASGASIVVAADITGGTLTLSSGEDVVVTSGALITATRLDVFVDRPDDDAWGGGNTFDGAFSVGTLNVEGGAGADRLQGAEGVAQAVRGRGGNDTLHSSGEGRYFGGAGNDTILAGVSGGPLEVLDGGSGTDVLDTTSWSGNYEIDMATGVTNYGSESFVNFEALITGSGHDTLLGTTGGDRIESGGGNDDVNGGAGNDTVLGADGDDTLSGGGAGADTLRGGSGSDTIDGKADDDLIDGGAAIDSLTGGAGLDIFLLRGGDTGSTRATSDVITDFSQAANDRINLSLVDANTGAGGDQSFTWIGTNAFTGVAGQLRYVNQAGSTFVMGDTDGDGKNDLVITLTGTIGLVAGDFAL